MNGSLCSPVASQLPIHHTRSWSPTHPPSIPSPPRPLSLSTAPRTPYPIIGVFEFPWYARFSDLLEPLFDELLGDQSKNVMRAQFALMPAHTEIKPHVDSGAYSSEGHRIHFVVKSNPDVSFGVCDSESDCVRLNTDEGTVFELNNRLKHFVKNESGQDRIHLVVDVAEGPRERTKLRVGQRCEYSHGDIVC